MESGSRVSTIIPVRFTFWLLVIVVILFGKITMAQTPTTDQLSLYFRADTLTTLMPGYNYVTKWTDISPKGYELIQNVGWPDLYTDGINKKPGLKYNGSPYYVVPLAGHEIQNTDFDLFFLLKTSATETQGLLSANGMSGLSINNGSGIKFTNGTATLTTGNMNDFTNDEMVIINVQGSATGGKLFVNGIEVASTTDNCLIPASNIYLMATNTLSSRFRGVLSELIVYKKNLTTQERADIISYFQKRYNLLTPDVQVSELQLSGVTSSQIMVNFVAGSGTKRMVLGKAGGPITAEPQDSITYPYGFEFEDGSIVYYVGTGTFFPVYNGRFNTTYYFKAFEFNGRAGSENYLRTGAPEASATTLFEPPWVSFNSIQMESLTSVRVFFEINAYGDSTTFRIAYGTDSDVLSDTTAAEKTFNDYDAPELSFERVIQGLEAGRYYYFKVIATNRGGSATSQRSIDLDVTPSAYIGEISTLRGDSVVVHTSVNAKGYSTSARILYGTTPEDLTNFTPLVDIGSGKNSVSIDFTIHGLSQGTMYFFSIAASNAGGEIISSPIQFYADSIMTRPNLVSWLRADDGLSNSFPNDPVSSWGASAGSGAFNNTGDNNPVYRTQGINAIPSAEFTSGSNLFMDPLSYMGFPESDFDIFILFQSSESAEQILFTSDAGTLALNSSGYGVFVSDAGNLHNGGFGSSGLYTNGTPNIINFKANAEGYSVIVNGLEVISSTDDIRFTFPESPQNTVFGNNGTGGFTGYISEIAFYNRSLTSSERIGIQMYLGQKYNIQASTLPVELSSFTGRLSDDKVILSWSTASEKNNAGWEIQIGSAEPEALEGSATEISNPDPSRTSGSGFEWETIGFVSGKGTTTEAQSYEFSSLVPRPSSPAVYRLKQLDLDGTVSYSQILTIEGKPGEFSLNQNYPNPFNPSTNIGFSLPQTGKVRLVVFDLLGREVVTLLNKEMEAGNHAVVFEASSLSAGLYFARISFGGKVLTQKMTLMK